MDAHPSPEDTESILLVDNNPTHLHVLWQTLCGRGLQLLMAPSGEEALAIARKAHPALIPTAPLMSCRQSLSALRSSGASHNRKEPEGCYRFAALQMMCTPFHRLK